jgi:hypothetical protein
MEAILHQGDIAWEIEFLIIVRKPLDHTPQYLVDIYSFLQKHQKVFKDIPPRRKS